MPNFNSILNNLTAYTTKMAPTSVIFMKINVFTYIFKHLADKVNVYSTWCSKAWLWLQNCLLDTVTLISKLDFSRFTKRK